MMAEPVAIEMTAMASLRGNVVSGWEGRGPAPGQPGPLPPASPGGGGAFVRCSLLERLEGLLLALDNGECEK